MPLGVKVPCVPTIPRDLLEHDLAKEELEDVMCFVLFLESKAGDRTLLDTAISFAAGRSGVVHCELAWIRPRDVQTARLFFSSYVTGLGTGNARWSLNNAESMSYYLRDGGVNWRAVPIIGVSPHTIMQISERCGLPSYSFRQYVASCSWFRWLGGWFSSKLDSPAHCGSLVARILLEAGFSDTITSHPSTYSPVRLYEALQNSRELHESRRRDCGFVQKGRGSPLALAADLASRFNRHPSEQVVREKHAASALLVHNFSSSLHRSRC